MNLAKLLRSWCDFDENSKVLIVTDAAQLSTANAIKTDLANRATDMVCEVCEVVLFEDSAAFLDRLHALDEGDLLIVALSIDTFVFGGGNRYFSPFAAPSGVKARSVFLRLGITAESLREGLATPKELVYAKLAEMTALGGKTLRITNAAGTDVTFTVGEFTTCPHGATGLSRHAFLPPSEISYEGGLPDANGKIVIDVTVGQLYYCGELLGEFGLTPEPVTLTVESGIITGITGGAMAVELKKTLFALPPDCRELVELGQGLSKMTPTGLIGVDESIIDTCHFGIGDGGRCGMHLDVVISSPTITVKEE